MSLDRSSQKWGFAFILFLLAFSNVLHPVVKDPTRLIESLPYDLLFPQGLFGNETAAAAAAVSKPSDKDSNLSSDATNNNDNNDNNDSNQETIPQEHESITTPHTKQLNSSDPFDHVVMRYRSKDPSSIHSLQPNSIPVLLWPFQDQAFQVDSADMIHIETNGVHESSVLYMAPNAVKTLDPNVVWLTDVKFPPTEWCKRLTKKAELTQTRRRASNLPLQWPIFVVDFTDQRTYHRCKGLEEVVGIDFMFYSKRSVVVNRVFDKTQNWVSLGTKVLERDNVMYEHIPLIVRTDIVATLQHILRHHYNNNSDDGIQLKHPIERLWNRTVDIAHYWPSDGKSGIGRFQKQLRDKVSRVLEQELGASHQVFCGVTGTADRKGRRKPQAAYIQHMLTTKIVVVTQRDEWEGHYRLYEALISGAMVMSDQMLIGPRLGLVNGTSIVEFNSAASLVSLAEYYLTNEKERQTIAARGRQVAMSQHRSWHRMEEIVLGSIVTKCKSEACPYVVHGNETSSIL